MLKYFKLLAVLLFATPVYADGLIITPSRVGVAQVGQIPGTSTNDNASSGNVGEFLSNTGTSSSLTNLTALSVASVTLSSGDWDIEGTVKYDMDNPTAYDYLSCYISTIQNGGSIALSTGTLILNPSASAVAGQRTTYIATPTLRVSINTPTTYYLNTYNAFPAGTMTGQGYIRARRIR